MNDRQSKTYRCVTIALTGLLLLTHTATGQEAADPQRVGVAELSPETERAIDKALDYIAANQNEDGSFGGTFKSACTALSLMSFMVKGHFPDRGPHGETLTNALNYLLIVSEEQNGYLGGRRSGMYEHGLATLALSEVWGESDDDRVKDALKKAVNVIFEAQHSSGGWRYDPRPRDHDLSVTVMQVVALTSAKEAGILVPDTVIDKALKYVLACQHPFEGGFAYQPGRGGQPEFARSAAGVMSLMMCGERDSVDTKRGLDYLLNYDPKRRFDSAKFYYYAHYYAIQVMYQTGGDTYRSWYAQIRQRLLQRQRNDGSFAGGQPNTSAVYATSMSVLILGVPYRYLPIYQR